MYIHNYRYSIGVTSQELSVLRKALLIAAGDEKLPDLNDTEADIAARLAKIIGGFYAAKRSERQDRQNDGGEDFGYEGEGAEQHQHSVPTGARQGQHQRS